MTGGVAAAQHMLHVMKIIIEGHSHSPAQEDGIDYLPGILCEFSSSDRRIPIFKSFSHRPMNIFPWVQAMVPGQVMTVIAVSTKVITGLAHGNKLPVVQNTLIGIAPQGQ